MFDFLNTGKLNNWIFIYKYINSKIVGYIDYLWNIMLGVWNFQPVKK